MGMLDCKTSHNRNENSAHNHLLAWKRKGINSQRESEVVSNKRSNKAK